MLTRIEKAILARDCDHFPKVEHAGKIVNGFQIMHNGLKIIRDCYCGGWMTKLIEKCKGHHEPQEEMAFSMVIEKIKDGGSMIEVGSSWSYYSMWFNQKIKNANNYMIDVDDINLNLGKENFMINGMEGNFFIGKIPDMNISDFIISNDIEFVDILHVDIQGWEYHLLEQIENIFGKIGYIFISTHTDKNNSGKDWGSPKELLHESCLEFLKNKKFVILCDHDMSESYSHDGLIVAKNPLIDTEFNMIEISKFS